MVRVTLITIGDELLRGRVVNTNASEAAQLLQLHGYRLQRVLAIPDSEPAILGALADEWPRTDVLLMCGGLGPTRDDITKKALAQFAGADLLWHEPTLQYLEARYLSRGRTLNELTRQQAQYPEGFDVLPNQMGTAPGLGWMKDGRWLAAMPGVPFEFMHLLREQVLPRMQAQFPGTPVHKAVIRLEGIPESDLAARIEPLEADFPAGFYISYLPRIDGMWLELILPEGEPETVAEWQGRIGRLFSKEIFALTDAPVPRLLADALNRQGFTLSAAESITAGRVASLIAAESGASAYYDGAVNAYASRLKSEWLEVDANLIREKTAVSEEVALAMAHGIRRAAGTDIGIATTGYAEPSGGHQPEAWIAAVGPGFQFTRHLRLLADRQTNIDRVAYQALTHLIRVLNPPVLAGE